MTIWHLKLFAAVAETGSMSAAAARYQIRQPSVSQKIAELETHYGVLLFERLGNRLHITESGRKLLEMARDVISRFDFLEEYMAAEHNASRLRIGGTVTVGNSVFPGIIQQFRAENPETEIYACISNTETITGKLMDNALDVALVEGKVRRPDLISIPMIDDFLVLACGKGHPFFHRDVIRCGELNGMDFVMREPGSGTRDLFEEYAARHNVRIRTAFEYNNPEAMRYAVCVNNCLSVISVRLLEEAARRGEVRLFRSGEDEWNRSFHLAYHKNKHINRAIRRFCTLLEGLGGEAAAAPVPMGKLLAT